MDDAKQWLWDRWIPRGCLSTLSGPCSSESALVAAWIACTLLRRGRLSGTHCPDPNREVMWLDSVDGYKRLLENVRALKTPDGIFWPVEEPEDDFPVLDMTQDRSRHARSGWSWPTRSSAANYRVQSHVLAMRWPIWRAASAAA